MPGLSCWGHLLYVRFSGGTSKRQSAPTCACQASCPEVWAHPQALWPGLSTAGSEGGASVCLLAHQPVGWRELSPNGLSCHSVPASTLPRTLPSQPLEEGPPVARSPAGPGEPTPVHPGPAMARQPNGALTVRASITSWKFLFPVILFFIARKASLGLDRGKKEGWAEAGA